MPNYPNPPITEALLDIRVQLPETISLVDLEGLQDRLGGYPVKRKQMSVEGTFHLGEKVTTLAKQSQLGYVFVSDDGKQIVQPRLNGFTFNRLSPYTGWNDFKGEARRLWTIYRDTVQPLHLVRMAVRYINRLDLPLPFNDFKEYLRTIPEVSPDMSQGLSGFIMVLDNPQADIGCMLRLTQAMVPAPSPDVASIMLDIDISRTDVPQEEDRLWEQFEVLRTRKNKVFEASITPAMQRLFE
jgi:uncharacterized protein (TIGR04255 family)